MAGQHLTSKVTQSKSAPWGGKLVSAVSAVGQGVAIANGIREALPVVQGIARTAGSMLPWIL